MDSTSSFSWMDSYLATRRCCWRLIRTTKRNNNARVVNQWNSLLEKVQGVQKVTVPLIYLYSEDHLKIYFGRPPKTVCAGASFVGALRRGSTPSSKEDGVVCTVTS